MKSKILFLLVLTTGLASLANAQIEPKEYLCKQDFFAETGNPNWDLALLFIRIKKTSAESGFECALGHTSGGFGVPSIAEKVPCTTSVDGDERLVFEAAELELDMHIDVNHLIIADDTGEEDGNARGPAEYYEGSGAIKMKDCNKKYYELVKHKFKCVEAKDVGNDRIWKM